MRQIPTLDEAEILVMKAVKDWTPVGPQTTPLEGMDADGLSLPKFIARRLFMRVAESVGHIGLPLSSASSDENRARQKWCADEGGCCGWWREIRGEISRAVPAPR